MAITYDFSPSATGSSVPSSGYSTSVSGVGTTITASGGNNLAYYKFLLAPSATHGIGHSGGADAALQIGESLYVTFTQDVVVNSLTFGAWDGADHGAKATVGGNSITFNSGSNATGNYTFNGLGLSVLAGQTMSINALSLGSVFTLRGMDVTPVPVPAAAWLFASAIGGLFSARRLRRKAA